MENALYTTSIPVQVNHLNYGNHLGYDSVLSIIQEARMRWLAENKMTELSIENGVGYLVTKVEVDYKAEAFYGDNLLINLAVTNVRKRSFEFQYEVINESSGKIVAIAKTGHVFYDFSNKKIAQSPDCFMKLLSNSSDTVSA